MNRLWQYVPYWLEEPLAWALVLGIVFSGIAAIVIALPVVMWFICIGAPSFLGPWYHYWLHIGG